MPALAGRKITPPVVRHTAACALVRAKVDINTVRAWLGHVNINATNIYAEIDLEMKARALALCDVAEPGPNRPWKEKKGLKIFVSVKDYVAESRALSVPFSKLPSLRNITCCATFIVQKAVVESILTPIYEVEFLGFSHGFRPGRGAHDALDALAYCIARRKVNWIVDADIRGFFDNLDRDWLIRFLEHRIGDRRVIRLITKWLNAGVMDGGEWKDDLRGTPQGAVVSPILANIYLHYVLDLWFDRKWRPQEANGDAVIVRYADDFVVGFQYRQDAEQFLDDLERRLGKFGLALHPGKTRCIEFGRFAKADRLSRGQRRPETFDFPGFTHYCRTSRKGGFSLGRKPAAKRARRTLQRIGEVLRRRRHDDPEEVARWLQRVLRGWLQYYAVPSSHAFLQAFVRSVRSLWFQQLRRRSQRGNSLRIWEQLAELTQRFFPPIRILHPWPDQRFRAVHTRGRSRVR